jgi:hypothetical protein
MHASTYTAGDAVRGELLPTGEPRDAARGELLPLPLALVVGGGASEPGDALRGELLPDATDVLRDATGDAVRGRLVSDAGAATRAAAATMGGVSDRVAVVASPATPDVVCLRALAAI